MNPKLFKDWLSTVEGLGKSVVAFFGIIGSIWATSTQLLDPLFTFLGMPVWSLHAGTALIILGFCFLLWQSFRHFVQASRLEHPDAFTLRPNNPETLVGRDEDLANLLNSVKKYRLVLLDGESGCGKSALVSAGLIYKLQQRHGLLPVLIRDWGEDWVGGPTSAALDALYQASNEVERDRLGWASAPDLAADTQIMLEDLNKRLNVVFNVLGLRPLLIADQFDDYQARHRGRFLNDNASWLSPATLANNNKFWELISASLHLGRLHLLVITRADTAAGMSCVHFLSQDQTDTRTLARVEMEYLRLLLLRITADNAHPIIVSHPEGGWEKLRGYIERDLKLQGAILMQQVRTVLLGLRQLPLLTPKHYSAAGGLRGIETLVISRALSQAGNVAGGGEAGRRIARAILGELVLPGGPNQPPKARRTLLSRLNEITQNRTQIENVLSSLQHAEVVRPVEAVEGQAWQLDHDYLAGAVLAEARQANRWSIALREGKARYDEVFGNWRQGWSSLLSIRTLLRIYWERFHGRLRFGEAAYYVLMSTIKPATIVLCLTLIGITTYKINQDLRLTGEANRLIGQFGSAGEGESVITVWRAPEALRQRVYDLVLEHKGNFDRAVRSKWPLAHAGLEPKRAREVLLLLRTQFEQAENSLENYGLATTYTSVAARLSDAEDIEVEVTALRRLLEKETNNYIARKLAEAYAAVAVWLGDEAVIMTEVTALRKLLEQGRNINTVGSLNDAYTAVAAQLTDEAAIMIEVIALRKLLEQERNSNTPEDPTVAYAAQAYAVVAGRLTNAAAIMTEVTALRKLLEQRRNSNALGSLAGAYAAVAAQLMDEAAIKTEVTALRKLLEREQNGNIAESFAEAYVAVAARLTDEEIVKVEVMALQQHLEQAQHPTIALSLAKAYTAVVTLLNDEHVIKAGVIALRQRLEQEEDKKIASGFIEAFEAVTAQLNDAEVVKAEVIGLRQQIKQEPNAKKASILTHAYMVMAERLKDGKVVEAEATAIRQLLMEQKPISERAEILSLAYKAVMHRLKDKKAVKIEATALRQWMEKDGDACSIAALSYKESASDPYVEIYATLAARQSDTADIKEAAMFLRTCIDSNTRSRAMDDFAKAYVSVAGRLKDEEIVIGEVIALRQRLEQEGKYDSSKALAVAYAAMAARLTNAAVIKTEVTTVRKLLEQEQSSERFAKAYAAVATQLTNAAVIRTEVKALRKLLEQEQNSNDSGSLAGAYVAVAAKLTDAVVIKAEVTVLRKLLEEASNGRRAQGLAHAYAVVAVMRNDEPPSKEQEQEILTLAGSPVLSYPAPLLDLLNSKSDTLFDNILGVTVHWSKRNHGIKPENLRPSPLFIPH